MSLIIPAAGLSSRFPDKPKWLLTCPNGNLMIQECIRGFDLENVEQIYITILEDHYNKYLRNTDMEKLFEFTNKKVIFLKLKETTKSQSETVYRTIKNFDIKGQIFIKDCDNFFSTKIETGNYVCYLKINENNNVNKIYNKSFIEINENTNKIINICEKKIISDMICVGGYSFENSLDFTQAYEDCKDLNLTTSELYISHIILNMCLKNKIFYAKMIHNYIDWGTISEWNSYLNNFKTLFIDIDGTLFYNCGRYSEIKWGENKPIQNNIDFINKLYNEGRTQIILTTSRPNEFKDITIEQLKKYNVNYDQIIFNLFHSKRYLINDFADTNPYPSAVAINIVRDSGNLSKLI